MSNNKPTKYDHKRFNWYEQDLFAECNRKILKCPSGYLGHLTSHLNQNKSRIVGKELQLQVIKYIAHSHFSHETDRGRHLLCEVGRTWVPAKFCFTEWTLHRKTLPSWIKKELYGE